MATKAKKLDKYSELQDILGKELPIHSARIKFMVLLICSLLKVQSVNFERLAQGFDNPVLLSSNLRRIHRFFASFALDGHLIARLLFKMLPFQEKYALSLDRTNWKFGRTNINILVLAVIYKGVAMPILWIFLGDKRGNSSQQERITLLQKYIDLFGEQSIDFLTADREFIGEVWWRFLAQYKIRFVIRIRENMQVKVPRKGNIKVYCLFKYVALHTQYTYPKPLSIRGHQVYLSGMKLLNDKGQIEWLIIACSHHHQDPMALYRMRWQIETMFRAFKSAGFDLECTHVTAYERLDKLLMITALAFIWAYKVGIYKHQNTKPLKIKKHERLEKSLFAYGLEEIAALLLNASLITRFDTLCRHFLSGT